MFTFLAEDSTYLVGLLVLGALLCLIGSKVTQERKYLIWALTVLGLALATFTVKQLWVTDQERIKRVVYELRKAVAYQDIQGVLDHLTSDVEYVQGSTSLSGDRTRQLIRASLNDASFDLLNVQDLQISAGRQTHRGKADFGICTRGIFKTSRGICNVGMSNSTWSLGFEETIPGCWKVNRITPVSAPEGVMIAP